MAAAEGKLKVILGYAAGVGKTFRMLEEGQTMMAEGRDVVIGYFEPHGRQDTIAKTAGLETIPRRLVEYRERTFDEMDTQAILARTRRFAWWMSSRIRTFPARLGPSVGKTCWCCSTPALMSSPP